MNSRTRRVTSMEKELRMWWILRRDLRRAEQKVGKQSQETAALMEEASVLMDYTDWPQLKHRIQADISAYQRPRPERGVG